MYGAYHQNHHLQRTWSYQAVGSYILYIGSHILSYWFCQ